MTAPVLSVTVPLSVPVYCARALSAGKRKIQSRRRYSTFLTEIEKDILPPEFGSPKVRRHRCLVETRRRAENPYTSELEDAGGGRMKLVKTTMREPGSGSPADTAAITWRSRSVKMTGWFSTAMCAIAQIWQCAPERSLAG